MNAVNLLRAFRAVGNGIFAKHLMTFAAGLSYYFVLSLIPMLIVFAAILAFLPVPHLFEGILDTLARVAPQESMGLVRRAVATVTEPHGGLLALGVLGALWSASSGFAGLIEALNVTYDIPETRPVWKTRLLALGLLLVVGILLNLALGLLLLGPWVTGWLQNETGLGWIAQIWPYAKWALSVLFTVLGVELLYLWAPNAKQRFWMTLPGAIVGVAFFLASSAALSLYFRHFPSFNRTYGILGGALALMVWLYYSWFAILVGASINGELAKAGGGQLELKHPAGRRAAPAEKRPAA